MKTARIILAMSILLLSACCAASAKPGHGSIVSTPGVNCPQVGDNGCSVSPGGSFQVANFYTGYTGTIYAVRPPKNMCGVDYKCGMPATSNPSWTGTLAGVSITGACGTDTMQDPKTAATGASDNPGCGVLPAHCAYSENIITAQLTVPSIVCSGTSNDIVLRGFNLAAVGGHDATYVLFQNTATGKKIVAFDNMEGSTSVYYQNGFASFASGSTGAVVFYAVNMYGHWVDSFSQQGTGTCTIAAATMTCSGESGFAVGQYLVGTGVTSNSAVTSVSGHTYTLNQSSTVSTPETITSQFQMAGGMGINTCSDITLIYVASTQVNGRIGTTSCSTSGGPVTVANITNRYSFIEGGIYTFGISHWEYVEYVLAGGQNPITYTNVEYTGNVIYQPSNLAAGSTTASFYISTGAVPAPIGGSFIATYTNPTMVDNTIVIRGSGIASSALATWDHGVQLTNLTITGNYIDKTGATNYALCNGNPRTAGGAETSGLVSFFTASSNASTNKLVVSAFAGGTPIVADGTNYVGESHQQILSQDSGTPGGAGTYSTAGGVTLTSRSMRSAYPAITNAPTISGNVDLISAAAISTSSMITRTLSTNPCVYPGMASLYTPAPRSLAANDNIKDADRRRAA